MVTVFWRFETQGILTAQLCEWGAADAPVTGFAGAEDYYARKATGPRLDEIRVPTLLIRAEDGSWIPAEIYRRFAPSALDNFAIVLASGGGHIGFHGRSGR